MLMIALSSPAASAVGTDAPADKTAPTPDSTEMPLTAERVAAIRINLPETVEDTEYWTNMARDLICLSQGAPFRDARLERSIENLSRSGRFSDIHVDAEENHDGMALTFRLTPRPIINEIDITGSGPVFESEIRRVMSIYPGKPLTTEALEQQQALITSLYRSKGFPGAEADLSVQAASGPLSVAVHVAIRPGPPLRVSAVHISGNHAYSDFRLKSHMKTWRRTFLPGGADRLITRELAKDIDRIVRFYWRKGYPDAEADHQILPRPAGSETDVMVHVDEGPRYEIAFSGNTAFRDRTLKKDITLFKNGNRYNLGIRKSVNHMQDRYRRAGYLEADISTTVKDPADNETAPENDRPVKHIQFGIDEGPRTIIRSITVKGNARLDTDTIREQILTRPDTPGSDGAYDPATLGTDLRAIRLLYLKNGFHRAAVNHEVVFSNDNTRADITITIDEGPRAVVRHVRFKGLSAISKKTARKNLRLKPGRPFQEGLLKIDENTLAALVSETGYPHVTVNSGTDINEDGAAVDIVHDIHQGPGVTMGSVYVTGNLRTRQSVIHNEITMETGDPFSLSKMLESQHHIRSLDIFRSVNFTPLGLREKDDTVHIFMEVHEKKPYFIEVSGGYNSEQGAFAKAAAGDHNMWGRNKDGHISWEFSETGYRGELGLKSQRFLGTRVTSMTNLYAEKAELFNQDFGIRIQGLSFGLSRQWTPALSTGLNLGGERRRKYPLATRDLNEREYEQRNTVALTPGITWDTRDNRIMPARGLLTALEITSSHGINSNLDDFTRYRARIHWYYPLLERVTLALIGRVGHIEPQNPGDEVSEDQLFFLGGLSSIRGFKENRLLYDANGDPVGGRTAFSGSIEARTLLGDHVNLVLFYDAGRLNGTYDAVIEAKTRSSVGLGLGIKTPVGPIGFYYGRKIDPKPDESSGRLHFSMGYTF
ncbi:MAG: outer membrane protein assembly factor BamA [Thermodesulfobacteriota bacterium]|nr:outer membrane protein assembly factor BamA [Thermodesulfobacteriota bacterium]